MSHLYAYPRGHRELGVAVVGNDVLAAQVEANNKLGAQFPAELGHVAILLGSYDREDVPPPAENNPSSLSRSVVDYESRGI